MVSLLMDLPADVAREGTRLPCLFLPGHGAVRRARDNTVLVVEQGKGVLRSQSGLWETRSYRLEGIPLPAGPPTLTERKQGRKCGPSHLRPFEGL
jgi:hypothetical protein